MIICYDYGFFPSSLRGFQCMAVARECTHTNASFSTEPFQLCTISNTPSHIHSFSVSRHKPSVCTWCLHPTRVSHASRGGAGRFRSIPQQSTVKFIQPRWSRLLTPLRARAQPAHQIPIPHPEDRPTRPINHRASPLLTTSLTGWSHYP